MKLVIAAPITCASLRAFASLESSMYFVMKGVRTAARMAITATTTTTSISVNPFSFRRLITFLPLGMCIRSSRPRPGNGDSPSHHLR
jgi:hypothetical protein